MPIDPSAPANTLAIAASSFSVAKLPALQRYLYANAGFGKVKDIPGLNDELWRFQVAECPLNETRRDAN